MQRGGGVTARRKDPGARRCCDGAGDAGSCSPLARALPGAVVPHRPGMPCGPGRHGGSAAALNPERSGEGRAAGASEGIAGTPGKPPRAPGPAERWCHGTRQSPGTGRQGQGLQRRCAASPGPPGALWGVPPFSAFSLRGSPALPTFSWGPSRESPLSPEGPFNSPRFPQLSLLLFGVCLFPPWVLQHHPSSSRASWGSPHTFLGTPCALPGSPVPSLVSPFTQIPSQPSALPLHPPTLPL